MSEVFEKQNQFMFDFLVTQLENKKSYQKKQNEQYVGKFDSRGTSIPGKDKPRLSWPKVTIDAYLGKLNWDVFENDPNNITKTLIESGIDKIQLSASKNALIGSCSFVEVRPGNKEFSESKIVMKVFTGSESTAFYDSNKNDFTYGLSINKYNEDGEAVEYTFYTEGQNYVIQLNESGEFEIRFAYETSIDKMNLIPFVADQDLAVRPFGIARLDSTSRSICERAVQNIIRSEIKSEASAIPNIYITRIYDALEQGNDDSEVESINTKFGTIVEMSQRGGSIDIKQTREHDPNDLNEYIENIANQYAAHMSMQPEDFGYVTNYKGTSDKQKFDNKVQMYRKDFGKSIEKIGKLVGMFLGYDETTYNNLESEYVDAIEQTSIGSIGDAILKISSVLSDSLDNKSIKKMLGISRRDEYLNEPSNEIRNNLKALSIELSNTEVNETTIEDAEYRNKNIDSLDQ